jgi:hypothetical protein
MNEPIDFVVAWVDGEDPKLKAKRELYLTDKKEASRDDVGGATRYRSIGEILYCIASINIFAPFARKIFILTDNQDPKVEQHIAKMFPGGYIPMEIVDHKDIFKDYENYLPTFNSRSLEAMLWRIPGLSEKFILMNDDFFFTAPVTAKDFFVGEKTVCYADWYSTHVAKLLRWIKPRKQGYKPIGFKDSMINALEILGGGWRFLYLAHTPRALRKSFYEKFFSQNEDVLLRNIRHRFRDADQYNSQELFYMTEARAGRCIQISPKSCTLYLKPRPKPNYIDNKIELFQKSKSAKFCCVNSLDKASEEDQQKVLDWVKSRLGL